MSQTAKRLKEMGVVLPKPAAPVANYVPSVRAGSLLFVSGQLPLGADGKLAERHQGKLSADSEVDAAREAAANTEPPSDLNASPEYRAHLAQVLVRRALEAL